MNTCPYAAQNPTVALPASCEIRLKSASRHKISRNLDHYEGNPTCAVVNNGLHSKSENGLRRERRRRVTPSGCNPLTESVFTFCYGRSKNVCQTHELRAILAPAEHLCPKPLIRFAPGNLLKLSDFRIAEA
jgi:hypothetical protein